MGGGNSQLSCLPNPPFHAFGCVNSCQAAYSNSVPLIIFMKFHADSTSWNVISILITNLTSPKCVKWIDIATVSFLWYLLP